jgi:hypothetical protein
MGFAKKTAEKLPIKRQKKSVKKLSYSQDISRVRGVHLQDIQGRSRSRLLQALDNAANGRLGLARRVKIFGTNYHLTTRSKIVNYKRFSFLIKRPLKIFMKYSG